MKTPLCTEVDLGTDHVVLDRDQASPRKGHSTLPFRTMSIVFTVVHLSYCRALVLHASVSWRHRGTTWAKGH